MNNKIKGVHLSKSDIQTHSGVKGKSTKAITERCVSRQNKSVCEKLARSCKKMKIGQKPTYALFARRPSIGILCQLKVHLTPKYFFRLNNSLHLFETHCAFLPPFSPNLDFLQAVKVTKSDHHLFHDRASKGYGSIPGLMSQTDLHRIKSL